MSKTVAAWMLIFTTTTTTNFVLAQATSGPEKQKIEVLIGRVGGLTGAKFIRNGSTYDVSSAVRFLRGKWQANDAAVKTAQDFIDKVASFSGRSNKPYLIRFNDGKEITSRDFLLAELEEIELQPQTLP